ncbi:SDR family NAD(P)-dependent oxidoreductase [Streptomyces flaveolus]|uniref:SDR family NAD(P)-dependent oxidoreductase n=1 Tax=Streptomyces flaveolus TaxID=67297 RepID=UPI00381F2071
MASPFRLDGRTAVVTGAAGAIGRAIAMTYAAAGVKVVCADLDAEGAERVAKEITDEGGTALAHRVDVSAAGEMTALVARAVEEFGALDIMCNNAGILIRRPVLEVTPEEFQKVVAVNLHSVFYGCQAAARVMGSGGVIINMASAIIDRPSAERASYAASKGGVQQLTRAFAVELGGLGIRVAGIAPGWVVSGITQQDYVGEDGELDEARFADRVNDRASTSPMNRIVDAQDIAHAALYLASDAGAALTGQILRVNGGTVLV